MFSAVFGTVKSLLLTATSKQENSSQSTENKDWKPQEDCAKYAKKCPYEGLEYGQFIDSLHKEDDAKEKSSFRGKVTDLLYGYGLINSNVYFTYNCMVGGQRPLVGDSVDVVAVRDHGMGGWKATRVNLCEDWDRDDQAYRQNPETGTLIGTITKVAQDSGFINETVPFDQDSLVFGYKPCRGDWIQGDLTCDPSTDRTQARNVRPLREQKFSGSVTHLFPGYGHVNGRIYFTFRVCEGGWRPRKGDPVEGRMIESKQSKGNWRAVTMKPDTRSGRLSKLETRDSPFAKCLKEDFKRNKGGITITDSDLGLCLMGSSKSTTVCIRNVGGEAHILTGYSVVCPTGDVSVKFSAVSTTERQPNQASSPSSLVPKETFDNTLPIALPTLTAMFVTLTVAAKQLGKCLCQVTYHFNSFSISRLHTLNVQDQQVMELVPEGYASGGNGSARSKAQKRMTGTREAEFGGCMFPGVRPTRNFDVNVPVKLPQYPVPRDMRTCVLEEGDLVSVCPQLMESLSLENFSRRFSALLHLEEIEMDEGMREFDMDRASMRPRGEFLSLEVPGLAEGRPSVLIGDKIIVMHPNSVRYEGYIHEVLGEAVLLKFHPSFHELYQAEECNVMFTYSRTSLRRCHQACEFAKNLGSQVLFPTKVEAKPPQVSVAFRSRVTSSVTKLICHKPRSIIKLPTSQKVETSTRSPRNNGQWKKETPPRFTKGKASNTSPESDDAKFVTPRIQDVKISHIAGNGQKMAEFINPRLNARQQSAVTRVLQGEGRPLPYIIFGPPGTGKTVTIVEAILQVLIHLPSSRILACTPSNSAADLLTERLHNSGKVNPGDMVRLNAFHRSEENIPQCIRPYSKDGENLAVISHQRIIVCTCITAGSLYQLGLKSGHFSHVFVDEAGQATEPECLIPVGLSIGSEGQIILAGDPMQLGPVLSSHPAKRHGLGQSYLERLILRKVYRRDADKYRDHGCYDPLLVTKLVENYRSHPVLLKLSSKLFYDNELLPRADSKLTHSLTAWEKLPNTNGDCPLLFHGVLGEDTREGNSPSWFNPVEVVQVIRYTQILLSSTSPVINTEDVGIITPYRKQVEKIRLLLASLGVDGIKVGSVEEFQGQERVAMIISTVRSSENLLTFDLRHHLGFLSNPKRFNVSITRAQALTIIVGNPHLLAKDQHWRALIRYCLECGAYTGCQPPALPPEEDDNEEELLDGGQEPDALLLWQQESKMDVGAHSSKDLESHPTEELASQPGSGVTEQGETTEQGEDKCSEIGQAPNGAVATQHLGMDSSHPVGETSARKDKADYQSDIEVNTNRLKPKVQFEVPNMNHLAAEDSSDSRPFETSTPNESEKTLYTSKPSQQEKPGLCSEVEKPCKVSHLADLTNKRVSSVSTENPSNCLQGESFNTNPSVELSSVEQLTDESQSVPSNKTNDGTVPTLYPTSHRKEVHEKLSLEQNVPVGSSEFVPGDTISDAKGSSTHSLSQSYIQVDKKLRVHSSFSFSCSDLEDPKGFTEFLDDNDLNQLKPLSKVQVLRGQKIPSRQSILRSHQDRHLEPTQGLCRVEKSEIHQEDGVEVVLLSDTFSDPEVCDPDKPLTQTNTIPSTKEPLCIRDSVSLSSAKNQPSLMEREQLGISLIPIPSDYAQKTIASPGSKITSDLDSVQICDEGEDPEIWDEEYDTKRVSHQTHGVGHQQDEAAASSEQQSEDIEKWDDYSWEVPPMRGLSFQGCPPLQEPQHTSLKNHLYLKAATSRLQSNLMTDNLGSETSLVDNSTHRCPAAETQLVEPDQDMPSLEGWPQAGMKHQDKMLKNTNIPTMQRTTGTHQYQHNEVINGHAQRQTDYCSTQRMSHSCEPVGGPCGTSPSPFPFGLGRGRGMLSEKLRQAAQSKKPGGKSSPFKNPWKVSAPTYSNSPHKLSSQQQIQVHHQTCDTSPDVIQGRQPEHRGRISPRTGENTKHQTTPGSPQQDAHVNRNRNPEENSYKLGQAESDESGNQEDSDDWSQDNHPPFIYRRPVSSHQKGRKWKYMSQMGSNTPRSDAKRYTKDEDFMGDAKNTVNVRNHEQHKANLCMRTDPRWTGAYPVAQSPEMLEDYDVIIESNGDNSSDCANTPQCVVHP
ncbi:RNA helicase Mov10l1-like [Acanthaster planci]|uniref:RNA helicase n=1 Tax=Acanthaster planci TaxID=133434 RepID=A0A8B7XJQ5_ACAPL|nr:RNA helicase Mov10l1-like [Acanthaster planci]